MLQQIVPVRFTRPIVRVMAALLLCCCAPSIAAPPTAGPTAVPTATPIPPPPTPTPIPLVEAIPLDEARRQMLATFQRWSRREEIGINCVLEQCNQFIKLQLTFMVPDLIKDLARLKMAELQQTGKHPTVPEFEATISEMAQRLKLEDHVTFMLVAKPGARTLPLNIGQTIPLQGQVSLRNEAGQSIQAAELDQSLNNISEEPDIESTGYILFKRKTENGADIFDMSKDRQVSIILQLPPDTKVNRQELAWAFDLLGESRPPPLTPTPTPVPGVLDITKDEWLDLAHSTIDLLREGLVRIPHLP
jgi:hypothetical protein